MQIKNKYSFYQKIQLAYYTIRTKLTCRKARLIRFPIEIRGRKNINLGYNLTTGKDCRLEAFTEESKKILIFGKNVQINDYVHITAMQQVRIGDNVLMASKIYISDCIHGIYSGDQEHSSPDVPPMQRAYICKPVFIEDNVWIGEFVSILPGVTVGKGSIIGANSVVTKNIPPYVIAVGIPAKPVKQYNFETKRWEKV
jgi:lipopolysaccharide O-acetyltransferase